MQTDGRFCHFTLAFLLVRAVTNSRASSLRGRYFASSLIQTQPNPSRLPGSPVIRLPAPPISRRDEEGFSSCLALPCHRAVPTNPAEVFHRISPCDAPCCLRPKCEGSAFGLKYFRGHMGSLALRPGDSLAILEDGFVNRLQDKKFPPCPAIQATGLGLLPRWDSLPLIMPAFAGRALFIC